MSIDRSQPEVTVRNVDPSTEELRDSTQQFLGSVVRAGTSLVLLPINLLSHETRSHFQEAGREVTLGVASLTRELTRTLENVAENISRRKS
jgi:hypothetical protein